jgi:hypothetical protein
MGNIGSRFEESYITFCSCVPQDYIKSALNTLIQAAYSKWGRAAKWHGMSQLFSNLSLAMCLFRIRSGIRHHVGQGKILLAARFI